MAKYMAAANTRSISSHIEKLILGDALNQQRPRNGFGTPKSGPIEGGQNGLDTHLRLLGLFQNNPLARPHHR
jgi:hypothetical protein